MFVCKLRTPFCANYENFHVYLDYRRQTGNCGDPPNIRPSAPPNKTLHTFQGVYMQCILLDMF